RRRRGSCEPETAAQMRLRFGGDGEDGRRLRRRRRGGQREPLLLALERDDEVVAVRRGVGGHLAVDRAVEYAADQGLLEGLHVEELTFADRVRYLLRLA